MTHFAFKNDGTVFKMGHINNLICFYHFQNVLSDCKSVGGAHFTTGDNITRKPGVPFCPPCLCSFLF